MTTQVPPPCDRFYNNLVCMKSPLIQAIVSRKTPSTVISPDIIEAAFTFLAFMNHQELLDTFIERTHVHWEIIATSKEVSPILDAVLGGFDELGKDRIEEIKKIVQNKEVDVEIQAKLLNLGKSLVRIAIRHLQVTGSSIINVKKMSQVYELDVKR